MFGRQRADDVIAGTDRDPTRLAALTDAEPDEGAGDEAAVGASA